MTIHRGRLTPANAGKKARIRARARHHYFMNNIRLVIFDLDGTLVYAYPAIIDSFNHTMRKLGLPRQKPRTITRAVGLGDGQLLKPFLNGFSVEAALKIYRRHHGPALRRKTRFLPGAKMILRTLKAKGLFLAVASNRPTKFSHIILRRLKIKNQFDYVLCGDRISAPKPAPDILKAILKRLSCRPAEALYVGDMTIDVLTGRRAKVRTVAVTTGSSSRRELAGSRPYKVVGNMAALAKLFKRT